MSIVSCRKSIKRCLTPLIEVCPTDRALRFRLEECIKCGLLPTHLELKRGGCVAPPRFICVEEPINCGCNASAGKRTRKVRIPEPSLLIRASNLLGGELVFLFDDNVLSLEKGRYSGRFHYADGSISATAIELDFVGFDTPTFTVETVKQLPSGGCDV